MTSDSGERSRGRNARALVARVGRWALVTAIIFLALIGFLHLTRGTAVRHVRGVAADGVPIAVSETQFPLSVTMLTGAWLARGNRVEVALNGDGTYPRLWEDLRSAQLSITLQLYYGRTGRMADTLRQILIDLRYSEEITAEQFRQRSWFSIAERAANLITRLLTCEASQCVDASQCCAKQENSHVARCM